jgi:hypothetical protein
MPGPVKFAVVSFGGGGLLMLCWSLITVFGPDGSGVADAAGIVGVVELALVGRLVDGQQWARIAAMSVALVQALIGVAALVGAHPFGLVVIALAGGTVVPLSTTEADRFFGVAA